MKFRKQKFKHAPDEGIFGDCDRTAIACLLDLEPEEVPHWGDPKVSSKGDWAKDKGKWLAERGYALVSFVFWESTGLDNILMTMLNVNPGIYYLLAGRSKTGVNHVVICCDDEIVHDPSLVNSGIVGPCDDGYFWVQFLVPLSQKKSA